MKNNYEKPILRVLNFETTNIIANTSTSFANIYHEEDRTVSFGQLFK